MEEKKRMNTIEIKKNTEEMVEMFNGSVKWMKIISFLVYPFP